MIFAYLRERRRRRIRATPPPPKWAPILMKNMPYFRRLGPADQSDLLSHIGVFLHEKTWLGCNGLEINEEIKVTIAGWACLMIWKMNKPRYFPNASQILVYPDSFDVPVRHISEGGVVTEGEEAHDGESWHLGSVVLAWNAVLECTHDDGEGYDETDGTNVVIHEFAHQLDEDDGAANGVPLLANRRIRARWAEVFTREYHGLQKADKQGRDDTVLDPYGAESPAEFFAVASETYFTWPHELREEHPELYSLLKDYYHQDPASLLPKPDSA